MPGPDLSSGLQQEERGFSKLFPKKTPYWKHGFWYFCVRFSLNGGYAGGSPLAPAQPLSAMLQSISFTLPAGTLISACHEVSSDILPSGLHSLVVLSHRNLTDGHSLGRRSWLISLYAFLLCSHCWPQLLFPLGWSFSNRVLRMSVGILPGEKCFTLFKGSTGDYIYL